MKILYDYQIFDIQKYGGATRYFCELIKNIPIEHQFKLSLIFSDNYYLKENRDFFKKIKILPDKNFKGKYFIQKKLSFLNQYYSLQCIAGNKFDLFHPTYYNNYFLKALKKPYIITVHDLTIFRFSKSIYKFHHGKFETENAIKNASHLIAISENTKKDIIDIFKINPDKIDVVYHGFINSSVNNGVNKHGRYILFVGQRGLHKNFITFAKAISILFNTEKDIKLICVGKPFDQEERMLLSKLKIADQTMAINVDDSSLNTFYANALVFVYPSLYEGFGMPILEAFANNCPVCLSDASCFPEIAGEAAAYFDPNSPDSILSSIRKIIYDPQFAKKIVETGQKKLSNFSWQKAANETVLAYKKTI